MAELVKTSGERGAFQFTTSVCVCGVCGVWVCECEIAASIGKQNLEGES